MLRKESCRITCQTVFLYLMKTMPCNKRYFQAEIKACRITDLSRQEGSLSNLPWEEEHRGDQQPVYTLLKTSSSVPGEAVPMNSRCLYKNFLSYVQMKPLPVQLVPLPLAMWLLVEVPHSSRIPPLRFPQNASYGRKKKKRKKILNILAKQSRLQNCQPDFFVCFNEDQYNNPGFFVCFPFYTYMTNRCTLKMLSFKGQKTQPQGD